MNILCVVVVVLAAEPRQWMDDTGEYSVYATFKELDKDRVIIQRDDGVITPVPLNRLSAEDRQWVTERVGRNCLRRICRNVREFMKEFPGYRAERELERYVSYQPITIGMRIDRLVGRNRFVFSSSGGQHFDGPVFVPAWFDARMTENAAAGAKQGDVLIVSGRATVWFGTSVEGATSGAFWIGLDVGGGRFATIRFEQPTFRVAGASEWGLSGANSGK
jgi:hypothetical protein